MKNVNVLAKLTLLAVVFLMCGGNVFSQSKIPVESIKTDWSLFQEVKGIKFYIKKEVFSSEGRLDVDCAIIKLENTSNKELNVSYSLAVHYNLGCNGCNSDEYYRTLVIPAHSSIEGKLVEGNSPTVTVLSNPNNKNGWIPEFITTEKLTIN